MEFEKAKEAARIGNITQEYIDYLKYTYINEILKAENKKAANALVSYATFLNKRGINSDNYPIYLKILETNHKYAIDALLEGHDVENYLDCVVPNYYLIERIFNIFSIYKRNEIYKKTLRVLFGFLIKVYASPEEGYKLYQPTVADINNLGKLLNEEEDQDEELNRDILDILMYISELDKPHETDPEKKEIARQAGRIRSDFFDAKRKLELSITETILEKAEKVSLGIPPEYIYVD